MCPFNFFWLPKCLLQISHLKSVLGAMPNSFSVNIRPSFSASSILIFLLCSFNSFLCFGVAACFARSSFDSNVFEHNRQVGFCLCWFPMFSSSTSTKTCFFSFKFSLTKIYLRASSIEGACRTSVEDAVLEFL